MKGFGIFLSIFGILVLMASGAIAYNVPEARTIPSHLVTFWLTLTVSGTALLVSGIFLFWIAKIKAKAKEELIATRKLCYSRLPTAHGWSGFHEGPKGEEIKILDHGEENKLQNYYIIEKVTNDGAENTIKNPKIGRIELLKIDVMEDPTPLHRFRYYSGGLIHLV